MRAVRILVATAAMLLAFGAAPAGAQSSNASPCAPGGPGANQYPPRDCGVGGNRSQVRPGEAITVTGQCPQGTQTVSFDLDPGNVNLGTATPDAQGNYSRDVTIPTGTRPGQYTIEATCEGVAGAGVVRSFAVQILGAVAGGTLPRTGDSSTVPLLAAGAGLVATGAVAVLAVRRRRSPQVATS
jgi:LPXTG-motif cell wall-anchored protein